MTRKRSIVRVKKHRTPCGVVDYIVEIKMEGKWLMTEDEYPTKIGAFKAAQKWRKDLGEI